MSSNDHSGFDSFFSTPDMSLQERNRGDPPSIQSGVLLPLASSSYSDGVTVPPGSEGWWGKAKRSDMRIWRPFSFSYVEPQRHRKGIDTSSNKIAIHLIFLNEGEMGVSPINLVVKCPSNYNR